MCTLYKMRSSVAEVAHMFGRFTGDRANLPPFDEIYPSYEAPILRQRDGELALEMMRWGGLVTVMQKVPVSNPLKLLI